MLKDLWWVTKAAVLDFFRDDSMTLAAALAYYTALSIAPLLVLLVWAASAMGPGARDSLVKELVSLIGPEGGEVIGMVVQNATERPDLGRIAGYISLGVLVFSAAAVFGQLQQSLNRIWNVKSRPKQGLWFMVRKRLLSFGMIIAVGFLLMVSMAVTAATSAILSSLRESLAGGEVLWQAVNFVASLVIIVPLFALIYNYLPDVKMPMLDVWLGAVATGLLFALGKLGIGLYLGHSSVGSAYGAAGSLVVLLVWVFYSSLIVFFGAELTQAWLALKGTPIQPSIHAIWADECKPGEEQALRKGRPDRRPGARREPKRSQVHPA
jgi:membrane protein